MTLPAHVERDVRRKEPCLTKRQLAAELQVSVRTVERLGLPHLRVGGQNRYYLSEVKRHLGHNVIELRPRERRAA